MTMRCLSETTISMLANQTRSNMEILANHIEAGCPFNQGEIDSLIESAKLLKAAKPPIKVVRGEEDL
jgi:hypothetical protein